MCDFSIKSVLGFQGQSEGTFNDLQYVCSARGTSGPPVVGVDAKAGAHFSGRNLRGKYMGVDHGDVGRVVGMRVYKKVVDTDDVDGDRMILSPCERLPERSLAAFDSSPLVKV